MLADPFKREKGMPADALRRRRKGLALQNFETGPSFEVLSKLETGSYAFDSRHPDHSALVPGLSFSGTSSLCFDYGSPVL